MHGTTTRTFLRTTAQHPAFQALVNQLDIELSDRYGETQKTYAQFNFVQEINTVIVVFEDSVPVGCGCFKPYDDHTAEIKRMYVATSYRGKGIARQIVHALEAWAAELQYQRTILETGDKQPEAIAVYKKMGYVQIKNFGPYRGMPSSLCFEKKLSIKNTPA